MFALIYSALLRTFGFGGTAANQPPLADSLPHSPVFQHFFERAEALKEVPPPKPMTWGEAVEILARLAGQRPASEAPPPDWRVQLAREVLPLVVRQYLYVLEILKRNFPRAGASEAQFEKRLKQLARADVRTWLAGLYSGLPVTIPEHITEVLIQRAANAMGQVQPQLMHIGETPGFFADAEMQCGGSEDFVLRVSSRYHSRRRGFDRATRHRAVSF